MADDTDKVWRAWHNPCVYESGKDVLSLHRSEDGARKAIEKHKARWLDLNGRTEPYKYEEWGVDQLKVLP